MRQFGRLGSSDDVLIRRLDLEALDQAPDVVCVLHADLRIAYVNPAWIAFGRANGAQRVWGAGDRLLDAVPAPLRDFYAEKFSLVLSTGVPWEHDYECSSATSHRVFRLRALPISGGSGLVVMHGLRVERPHGDGDAPRRALDDGEIEVAYRGASGLIAQCSHCRRVRRAVERTWDWVPALVERQPKRVTHSLCEVCFAYYFGPAALDDLGER